MMTEDSYTEYGYRGVEEIKKLQQTISELKQRLKELEKKLDDID